ncbi:MAG: type IV pilus modification PilV family protein [Planctomycetota bacterium]
MTRTQRNSGFSLLEVLVALGIVTIGVTAVLALFASGVDIHKQAVDQSNAALVAQTLASELEAKYTVARIDAWLREKGKKRKKRRISGYLKDIPDRRPVEVPGFPGYRYSVKFTPLDPDENAVLARIKVYWRKGGGQGIAEVIPVVLLKRPY